MVDTTLELVLVTAAVVTILYASGFLIMRCMKSQGKGEIAYFPHMRPLILPTEPSAVHLRLDAALRDAEDGFNACAACGFENLKRNIFCSLCGSPVDAVVTPATGDAKDKLHAQRQLASSTDNHRRKARALKRKEWVRKVDVAGKLFWFRGASTSDAAPPQRHGYVVHFAGEPLVAPVSETSESPIDPSQPETEALLTSSDTEIGVDLTATQSALPVPDEPTGRDSVIDVSSEEPTDDGEERPEAPAKPRLVLHTLEEINELILAELSTRQLTVIDSSASDPARPAVVIQADSIFAEDPATLVHISALDFPSKMAEFVTRTSRAVMVTQPSFLRVNIHRDKLLKNSVEALAAMPTNYARSPVRMSFIGEQGIDAGGVYREWLELISQQLVTSPAGVFRCVDARDRSFYLNPTSQHDIGEHHLAHFFATGRLLGRMLLEGNVTGFHLALPLLKIIVGQPVTLSDLEYFDADTYKSLSWLLANEGVDALGLDFTVTEQALQGETITVELVPNGSAIDVTDANKREYVDRKLQYVLFESVQHQLFAFLKGLYEVMPPELLMMFDAEELDFVLSGSDEIDVDDWERTTKATVDLVEHPVLFWFWELVREMPNEYRRRLLLFATGSSRVPLAGFGSLTSYDGRLCPFTLKGVSVNFEGGYIRSHACFNLLDLPRFYKKSDLKAVLYAVLDTDLYGFTSA